MIKRKKLYRYNIDFLTKSLISGWVVNKTSQDKISFSLEVNKRKIMSIVANEFRKDLKDMDISDGYSGFSIRLKNVGKLKENDSIKLIDDKTNRIITSFKARLKPCFHIDNFNFYKIEGWQVEIANTPLIAKINNKIIGASSKADIYRKDIQELKYSEDGCCGFTIPVIEYPENMTYPCRLEILDKASNQLLGTYTVKSPPLFGGKLIEKRFIIGFKLIGKTLNGWFIDLKKEYGTENLNFEFNNFSDLLHIHHKLENGIFEKKITQYPNNLCPKENYNEFSIVFDENCFGTVFIKIFIEKVLLCEEKIILNNHMFKGNVEFINDKTINGWVYDINEPTANLNVTLKANNITLLETEASLMRLDVKKKYPESKTNCGFSFKVPQELHENEVFFSIIINRNYLLNNKFYSFSNWTSDNTYHHSYNTVSTDDKKITIIIPVFNAYKYLKECLSSVVENSPSDIEILISDDASTDENIYQLLKSYEKYNNIRILYNKKNLGYTVNINNAINSITQGDIILLNSDTEVTPNWIKSLRLAAYSDLKIGTVTAVSDNAGSFSVPNRNERNPIPSWLNKYSLSRLIKQITYREYVETVTGNGFCMYIKRELIDDIGLFDEKTFARGYCEENDFCMRAIYNGWRNIIAQNVIIYHERTSSFKETKEKIFSKSIEEINRLYPEYDLSVANSHVRNTDLIYARWNIANAINNIEVNPKPRVLYVINTISGGTPKTNEDLMEGVSDSYDPYVISCNTHEIFLMQKRHDSLIVIEKFKLARSLDCISHDNIHYSRLITNILLKYSFELIHIRHIGRHGFSLVHNAKALGIPIVYSFHDYYSVCPNIKLLDCDNYYCSGNCSNSKSDYNDCTIELWNDCIPILKNNWVNNWKVRFSSLLKNCDYFVTTSQYAKTLIQNCFNFINDNQFSLIPHGRDFDGFINCCIDLPQDNEPLKILVPGHINDPKGADLIKRLKALDYDNILEFHFIGNTFGLLDGIGINHGKYNRENFVEKVLEIKPHIGAVLSIWPETYCHTLTELWACGLPVIVTPFGALQERMQKHGGGWILKSTDINYIFNKIKDIIKNHMLFNEKKNKVLEWQKNYGYYYQIEAMAIQYKNIYNKLLSSKRDELSKKKIVFITSLSCNSDDLCRLGFDHLHDFAVERFGADNILIPVSFKVIKSLNNLEFKPDGIILRVKCDEKVIKNDISSLEIDIPIFIDFVECFKGNLCYRNNPYDCEQNENVSINKNIKGMIVYSDEQKSFTEKEYKDKDIYLNPYFKLYSDNKYAHNKEYIMKYNFLFNWERMFSLIYKRKEGMISIIIPVFDQYLLTKNCLDSIINKSTYKNYEIVLVNNGSSTATSIKLIQLSYTRPNVRVIHNKENLMFSLGCNIGFSHSVGEYVLFLNNDTEVISEKWLEEIIHSLKNKVVGVVSGHLLYMDDTTQHAGISFNPLNKLPFHIYNGIDSKDSLTSTSEYYPAVTGACMGMRASDFVKLKGFSPNYLNGMEDIDLCLRMKRDLSKESFYNHSIKLYHFEGKSKNRGKYNLYNRKTFIDKWKTSINDNYSKYYTKLGEYNGSIEFMTNEHDVDFDIRFYFPLYK